MRASFKRHVSFSNAISVLALFVALGGTTYAAVKLKADSVGSRHVRDDSLSGADVREATLGPVPSAESAARATEAASAANAGLLDGIDSAQLARRGLAMIAIGGAHQAGNPPGRYHCLHSDGVSCDAYWQNLDAAGGYASGAYGRDDFGVVHLQGAIAYDDFAASPVPPGPVFTLPAGMRPADQLVFTVLRNGTDPVRLDVEPDGEIRVGAPYADGDWFSLDGVDFPAAAG